MKQFYETVMSQVSVKLPSVVVTVTVAEPVATASTVAVNPVPVIVAILPSLGEIDHVTVLSVAFAGAIVAVKSSVSPTLASVISSLSSVTPVTATLLTVTSQVSVKLPSTVVAVMVADPADTPVTTPFASTLATLEPLELHVTALLVAFEGVTVATSVSVLPTLIVVVSLLRLTPVTETGVT